MTMVEDKSDYLPIINQFWNSLLASFDRAHDNMEDGNTLHFNPTRRKKYTKIFSDTYSKILDKYMTAETVRLDAHKVAAISILAALKAEVVSQEPNEDLLSFGPYVIALDTALSYLSQKISEKVRVKYPNKESIDLVFPVPFICDTEYFDVMARLLYYENDGSHDENDSNMRYNIFEWADRFFLLEYLTYLQSGIDPKTMREPEKT